MYFDKAISQHDVGISVVFVTLDEDALPYTFTFTEKCSNNVVEYQALILELEIAIEKYIPELIIFGDSKLVVINPPYLRGKEARADPLCSIGY